VENSFEVNAVEGLLKSVKVYTYHFHDEIAIELLIIGTVFLCSCTTFNNFKPHMRLHWNRKPGSTVRAYLGEWTLYGVSLCLLMPSARFTLVLR